MKAATRKRPGRPATSQKDRRGEYVGFRAPRILKEQLEAAARQANRSLSSEAQFRLEQSFDRKALLPELLAETFGIGVAGLLFIAGRVMREAGNDVNVRKNHLAGPSWAADPDAFSEALTAARTVLEEFQPEGELALPPSKTSTGARYAKDRISKVVNQGAPYPYGEKPWIDLARELLGPDLLKQSRFMRTEAKRDAEIEAAWREEQDGKDPQ